MCPEKTRTSVLCFVPPCPPPDLVGGGEGHAFRIWFTAFAQCTPMEEDDWNTSSALQGLNQALLFHQPDDYQSFVQVNAHEVLTKDEADRRVHLNDPLCANASANDQTVHGDRSMGCNLFKACQPNWGSNQRVVMLSFKDEATAVDRFIAEHAHGDAETAALYICGQRYTGFKDYGTTHVREHAPLIQQSSTVLLKRTFFQQQTIRTIGSTPIHVLEHRVSAGIKEWAGSQGNTIDLRLVQCHILRQGTLHSCWGAHVDNQKDLSGAHLTAVVNASPFQTAMRICGDKNHFDYSMVGDTALFPSDLYHYTSQACIGTIKVAFFYSIVSNANMPIKKRRRET